jgi:hypothetical protein
VELTFEFIQPCAKLQEAARYVMVQARHHWLPRGVEVSFYEALDHEKAIQI